MLRTCFLEAAASGEDSQTTVLSPDAPSWEDVFEPVPSASSSPVLSPAGELKLSRLGEVFASDGELLSYLGDYGQGNAVSLQSSSDAQLWNEIQRKLLRVPKNVAQSWRERALMLAHEAGAIPDWSERSLLALPFIRDEAIYPGLTGTIQARGLRFSTNKPLHPRVQGGMLDGDLYFLACIVSICLKFIESDRSLHHAFKSIYRFGVKSLHSDPEESNQYINALIDCFRRVQKAEESSDAITILQARLDLDEAIHSLVFLPPGDRYSWWGKLQQESRRTLDKVVKKVRNAGYKAQIRPLWDSYADIYTLSNDDYELDSGGIPMEVLACLRVYAQIDQEVYPGRVLFRSSSANL